MAEKSISRALLYVRFSGRGHAAHICKSCYKKPPKTGMTRKEIFVRQTGSVILANRSLCVRAC